MCLLIAVRRNGELVLGANRDERLNRPWQAPALLLADPPVVGGRDLGAGGSWLAVNVDAAFVAAVTNARLGAPPGERSRGQLVIEAAAERSLAGAVAVASELDLGRYGPFNLLLADAAESFVVTNHPAPRIERATVALLAIGNDRLDDPGPRTRVATLQAGGLTTTAEEALEPALVRLLADHGGSDPFCRHGAWYGTVCSALLRLGHGGITMRFAAGPPCTAQFAEVALPLSPAPAPAGGA